MPYRVAKWEQNFEGAKSKTYNNKSQCSMPTKHGLGYRRLIMEKDGPALFGAWCSMIQLLSRHPKKRQGYITDDGTSAGVPLTPSDLEVLTGIAEKHFKRMLQVCSNVHVRWIEGYHKEPEETIVPLNSDLDSNLNPNSDPLPTSKSAYGEFENVKLTQEQYDRLCSGWSNGKKKFSTEGRDEAIEQLSQWIASKGKRVADCYATLQGWPYKNYLEGKSASGQTAQINKNTVEDFQQDDDTEALLNGLI